MRESTARRKTISASSFKSRQLTLLNAQLLDLQENLNTLKNHMEITSQQALAIERLGILHGSLFMAVHRISEHEVDDEK